MRLEREQLRRDPLGVQDLLQVLGGLDLPAGRIGGIELHERLEVLQRLGLEAVPVRLRRRLRDAKRRRATDEHRQSFRHETLAVT
jgi:hypothetical protein